MSHSDKIHIDEQNAEEIPVQNNDDSKLERTLSSLRKVFSYVGIVITVILTLLLLVVIFWKPIAQFLHLYGFKSPQQHFAYVETQAATKYADSFAETYGKLVAHYCSEKTTVQYDVEMKLGDQLLNAVNTDKPEEYRGDLSWLQELSVSAVYNKDLDNHNIELSFGFADHEIVNSSIFWNYAAGDMWFGIPEISQVFMKSDIEAFFENYYGLDPEEYSVNDEDLSAFLAALPSEQVINQMIKKYTSMVINRITDVDSSRETIALGTIHQECTVLTATIREKELIQIFMVILQALKDDELILNLYADMGNISGQDPEQYQDGFIDKINVLLADLDQALAEAKEENYIQWIDYVNDTQQIIGRRIRISGSEKEYYTCVLMNFSEVYFEYDLFDMIRICGGGELSGMDFEGNFDVYSEGKPYCCVMVDDFTWSKYTIGHITGNYRITLDESVSQQLFSDGINKQVVIDLKLKETDKSFSININALIDNSPELDLYFKVTDKQPMGVRVPDSSITINHEEDMIAWLETVDLEPLIRNLKKAGATKYWINSIEQYWDEISAVE